MGHHICFAFHILPLFAALPALNLQLSLVVLYDSSAWTAIVRQETSPAAAEDEGSILAAGSSSSSSDAQRTVLLLGQTMEARQLKEITRGTDRLKVCIHTPAFTRLMHAFLLYLHLVCRDLLSQRELCHHRRICQMPSGPAAFFLSPTARPSMCPCSSAATMTHLKLLCILHV